MENTISIMARKMFCVFALVVLGVFHKTSESQRVDSSFNEGGWLSNVIKEANTRRKRFDPEYYDEDDYVVDVKIDKSEEFENLEKYTFLDDDFSGWRSNSIVRVWTIRYKSPEPLNDNEEQCLGVVVHKRVILTPCSCVATHGPDDKKITPWDHHVERKPLNPIHGTDVYFESQLKSQSKTKIWRGETTVLHPRCDNYFDVDLAAVIAQKKIEEARLVWVHTTENILFQSNLPRVVAGQAVSGKCSVPVMIRFTNDKKETIARYEFLPVFFQHWTGCLQNVCPTDREHDQILQKRHRCYNKYAGTRYCLGWKGRGQRIGLCNLMPGTPVFCDVGEILGFMGFIVSNVYTCPLFEQNQAVMQGFNDGVNWIRSLLESGFGQIYQNYIPDWVKNLRQKYYVETAPETTKKPGAIPIIRELNVENFKGSQTEAIVKVYWSKVHRCYGTMVGIMTAVVPCSCVTTSKNVISSVKWNREHEDVTYRDIKKFEILSLADYIRKGPRHYTKVTEIKKHKKCDNHYLFDYAVIELESPLPRPRVAWLMTLDKTAFTKILLNVVQADLVYGNCYYMQGEITKHIGSGDYIFIPRIRRVRFENWSACLYIACNKKLIESGKVEAEYLDERCQHAIIGDPRIVINHVNGTHYCISADPYDGLNAHPMCSLTSGTPVFCDVEEARGFIGFIGGPWTDCPTDAPLIERDRAVLFGIDEFIDEFGDKTFLHLIQELLKQHHASIARPVLLIATPVHPIILLLISSIISL